MDMGMNRVGKISIKNCIKTAIFKGYVVFIKDSKIKCLITYVREE